MANSKSKAADMSVEDLSNQIAVLKGDLANLTTTLAQVSKAKTNEVAANAKETVGDLATAGRAHALDAQEKAEEFIHTQPATALGIAAGIGFLVGLLTVRR